MSEHPDIVLASASPRRRELLAGVGLVFQVIPSCTEETALAGETPEQHAIRLSEEKAREVAARVDVMGRWFIGSDTIVVRDDEVLGKPADSAEAAAMLRSLSGRAHRVISGYAVFDRQNCAMHSAAVTTRVYFKRLTEIEIGEYIATGEPFDKAGAYAIQGIGAFMVPRIEGSYTNVVGLPLCEVIATLEEMGAWQLFSAVGTATTSTCSATEPF
jgi:septum formation protein